MASRRSSQLSYSRARRSSISAARLRCSSCSAAASLWVLALALVFVAGAVIGSRGGDDGNAAAPGPAADAARAGPRHARRAPPRTPPIHWRASRSLGTPTDGRLVRAVHLPAEGADFVTWHPVTRPRPNASCAPLELAPPRPHAAARAPRSPRARIRRRLASLVGDLSLRRGGPFPPDDDEEGGARVAPERPRRRRLPAAHATGCSARRYAAPRSTASSRRTSSTASWRRARRRSSSAGGYGCVGPQTSCSTGPATATTCTSAYRRRDLAQHDEVRRADRA